MAPHTGDSPTLCNLFRPRAVVSETFQIPQVRDRAIRQLHQADLPQQMRHSSHTGHTGTVGACGTSKERQRQDADEGYHDKRPRQLAAPALERSRISLRREPVL